jgi:hypothetical protein
MVSTVHVRLSNQLIENIDSWLGLPSNYFASQGWFGSEQGLRQSHRMERGVQGLSKTLNFFKKGPAQHEIQPVGSVLSLSRDLNLSSAD